MPGKNYSLHPRTTKKGTKIFYVQFRLPTGRWGNAISTGETTCGRAEEWVIGYLNKGQHVLKKNITLFEFAGNDFFSYGQPWELNKRIAAKKKPSPRWCMECTLMLNKHIIPTLGNYRLNLIDEEAITAFRNNLFNNGFSGSYINKILTSLREILKSAYKKALIQSLPEIELAALDEKRRGRLTRQEVAKIFSFDWSDERAYVASLISAVTGARLSEIQALRVNDIRPDGTFTIRGAWDRYMHQVKPRTKSGAEREAALPEMHFARIIRYLDNHPYRAENGFLIWSEKETGPAGDSIIMRPFHAALEKIGISKETRQKRGICFHSWRYYCNSALIEAGQPEALIRERIGHADSSMTLRYFRSENIDSLLRATAESVPLPETVQTDKGVIN